MTSSDFNIPATAAPSGQLASAAAAAKPVGLHVASGQADIDAALADPSLAALLGHGAPVIVASGAPAHILFASASACALFGTRDPDLLRSRVFGGRDPASQRLAVLVASLVPSSAPRLERLRFFFGTSAETLTIVCRSVLAPSGGHVVAFAATGVRAALMRPLPVPAQVADHAAPLAVPAEPAFVPHVRDAEAAGTGRGADAAQHHRPSSRDDDAGTGLATPDHAVAAASPLPATVHAAAPAHLPETVQSPAHAVAVGHTLPAAANAAPAIIPADPVRFAWRSDARQRVTDISDAFLQAFGLLRAQICGHSWQELATNFGFDPDGHLHATLQHRASWSGLDLSWPLQAEGVTVPVSLGGAPVFDAARSFEGHRGFGVIRFNQRQAAPVAQTPAAAPVQPHVLAPSLAAVATQSLAATVPAPQMERASLHFSEAAGQVLETVEAARKLQQPGGSAVRAAVAEPVEAHQVAAPSPQAFGVPEVRATAVSDASVPPVDAAPGHTGFSVQTFEPAPEAAISSHAGAGLDLTAPASDQASLILAAAAPAHHGATASADAAPHESGIWLKDGLPADAPDTDDPDFEELLSQDLPHEDLPHEVLRQETSLRDESHRVTTPAQLPGLLTPPEHKPPAQDMLAQDMLAQPVAEALSQPGEADAPHRDAKIVRLRPLMVVPPVPLPAEARPLAASIANDHNPQALSTSEHHAFREIARKLGGQVADVPVADSPPLKLPVPVENRVPETAQTRATPPATPSSGDADAAHVLQRLPLGVLVSRNGEPLLINRMLLDMLGYSSAHAFSLSHGMERMFKGRAPESLDPAPDGGAVPIVALDGEVIMAEARMQSIDWSGQPATLITLRRAADSDNGARLRSLEMDLRLREAEARELHAILDTATDGVVVLDDSGRILSLNRSAEALFGYDQNEVAGENFTTLIARDSQAAATGYLEGIRGNGVATVLNDGREIFARARQGGAIPIFMTLGRVGSGAMPKFCAVLRDLTQWKKAERELSDARLQAEHASALKSDFLAKISHEIRTPLNAILGFAEVMIEERFGAIGNDRYKDYLKDIHGSGKHVMSLVNDLLDLSKIEAGKMELEFSSVDANKIVAECVSLMQPEAARERVVMRQSLAPRLPNVVADERALRQIVLNLLSNAVKFNETGGQVIISTALTDAGHAVIRIRDTGIGMSEEDVQVALEPFRQLQTARKHSGTGLGLPLTKALVEANRASFSIKSKKNEGTLVEVAFPPTRVLAE